MPISAIILLLTAPAPLPDSTKRFSFFPLPVVYYTPETRLAYGAAATATFRLQKNETIADSSSAIRPSQLTVGAAYTQNKQLLLYMPFQLFYNNNRYYFTGEVGYYRYNYYFFGVGDQRIDRELYGVNFPRIRINAFRQIADRSIQGRLYAGIRYQFEDYSITESTTSGKLSDGSVSGSGGSRLSGAGLGLFYDSRNNVFFPSTGHIAELTYLTHQPYLGSNVVFNRWMADVSSYYNLSKRTVLALNYFVSLTTGKAPFNALSLLGGTKKGRGFYEGRFRDDHLALIQAELRLAIWQRLGAVVFGSGGVLGNQQTGMRFRSPKATIGAGLRFRINRDKLNLRLDYGLGLPRSGFGSSGLYVTVGEAF